MPQPDYITYSPKLSDFLRREASGETFQERELRRQEERIKAEREARARRAEEQGGGESSAPLSAFTKLFSGGSGGAGAASTAGGSGAAASGGGSSGAGSSGASGGGSGFASAIPWVALGAIARNQFEKGKIRGSLGEYSKLADPYSGHSLGNAPKETFKDPKKLFVAERTTYNIFKKLFGR